MPIGSINKDTTPKRDNFRPPWVKDKDTEAPPPWTQRKLKPVDSITKTATAGADEATASKPALKPVLKKQSTVRDKPENGVIEPAEEKLVKPSQAKQADRTSKPSESKFIRPATKVIDKNSKIEDKPTITDKIPEKPSLKTVKINDEKPKEKTVTIIDKGKPTERVTKANNTVVNSNDKGISGDKVDKKPTDKVIKNSVEKTTKPVEKNSIDKTVKTVEKNSIDKPATIVEKNTNDKTAKATEKVSTEKTTKPVEKTKSTKPSEKVTEKNTAETNNKHTDKTIPTAVDKSKLEESEEDKSMATKPPLEKTPSKLPPRKPSLPKQMSKDDGPVKKWRDPLHERVKESIDKTLANDIPKGHTLTKNESLRSLLKPTPPPMPPPLPPKMPPPPEFKKAPIDPTKLKKLEQLRSRPRRRPDWTDMMKEVEEGKKLKHVVCNDRSSPVITRTSVVKNKDQFIFESEKPNAHNDLLKEINKGLKLKKVKTNDRSKPNLEGLRKFRRQLTIEEQVQKSMSQANLAASPSRTAINTSVPEATAAEEEDIDEMDDIDKVRDDLQSTKQLLAIELRNKEVQERENKRLLTRIQNLEAELARERAIIKQEQHKTVISVTDAYDERLVNSLKMEVDRAKESADSLEKQYLEAAEERDTALTELEEVKRKNAELEKKLEQAMSNKIQETCDSEEPMSFYMKRQLDFEKECRLLNIDINSVEAQELKKTNHDANNNAIATNRTGDFEGILPSNVGSRRSSHAIKQLSIQKDSSFEEEEESEEEEEETEEKKQKRLEKEVKNMRNKIRHLKEKQDNMKRERAAYKVALKNQQAGLKDEKKKYKELKREVDKMAAMMKEVGSDEEDEDEETESEEDDEKKSESEEEESETETEQDTESETESESEPEDAPLPNKKENLTKRVKRHETRVNALKKGNTLLMANVDRLKDDVNKQREESMTLKKELDSLIDDFA